MRIVNLPLPLTLLMARNDIPGLDWLQMRQLMLERKQLGASSKETKALDKKRSEKRTAIRKLLRQRATWLQLYHNANVSASEQAKTADAFMPTEAEIKAMCQDTIDANDDTAPPWHSVNSLAAELHYGRLYFRLKNDKDRWVGWVG